MDEFDHLNAAAEHLAEALHCSLEEARDIVAEVLLAAAARARATDGRGLPQ